ncbi:MAG: ABC transporter permease subunit [Candidatus Eremiobacteraeota bacterium]|nr:ABC transporter permease subunit [Candidatus Eremiobacteraeota bacterium]
MKRSLLPLGGIALVLLLWEVAGRRLGDALLAPPSAVIVQFVPQLFDGSVLPVLADSLRQMLIGFGLAYAFGVPAGVLMARSRTFDALAHPWLSMGIVTSIAALVPLFILMFGTGFSFRVSIVFFAAVWFVALTVYQGARGIDPRWLEVGRAFEAGPLQSFWKIMLPALCPYLIIAARIGVLHAIRAMVVAETFVVVGYGALIHNSGLSVSTAPLLGLLLVLMALGALATWILRRASSWIAPWYQERASA